MLGGGGVGAPTRSKRGAGVGQPDSPENSQFQLSFSNNAFASAILNEDETEQSGDILRNEVMESIMNHEAAAYHQEQQQQPSPQQGSLQPLQQPGTSKGGAHQVIIRPPILSASISSRRQIEMTQSRVASAAMDRATHSDLVEYAKGRLLHGDGDMPITRMQREENHPTIGVHNDSDNYSFRPNNSSVPLYANPGPRQQQSITNRNLTIAVNDHPMIHSLPDQQNSHIHQDDRLLHTNSTMRNINDRKVSFTNMSSNPFHNSSNSNYTGKPQNIQTRRQSNESGRSSIFSSGLSSIKVQISEFDRLILQRKESDRSIDVSDSNNNYEVPLPQMPYESKNAMIIRIAIGIICMITAILITIFLGRGQFGHASSSFMYHNFVLKDDTYFHHHNTLNDETTKNGSHLFEKVQTLERAYRPNVLGNAKIHIPSVSIDENGDIFVSVKNHEMVKDHYIEFIWVKHVDSNQVVLAKNFDPSSFDSYEGGEEDENSGDSFLQSAVLKARVPDGVKLKPYLFCNRHELWAGEEFQVPS